MEMMEDKNLSNRLLNLWGSLPLEQETIYRIAIVPVEESDTKIAGIYFTGENKTEKNNGE